MAADTTLKGFAKRMLGVAEAAEEINENEGWGYDGITTSMLLGSSSVPARNRIQIYELWHLMMGDPIISTALRSHVTHALGGHETSGDTVFMEVKASAKAADRKVVEDIGKALLPLLNREAHALAFRASGFGDGYLRIFRRPGEGVIGVYGGEGIWSPLVQPYEQADTTTGYVLTGGKKGVQKLTVLQMARCKMKRMNYVPQVRAQEQAERLQLLEDDPEKWPHLPSLVGGSFLDPAEVPWRRLHASLAGLVSNRILGSMDESLMTINTEGMTKEQAEMAKGAVAKMLQRSRDHMRRLVERGEFPSGRITHLMPIKGDKAITTVSQFQGSAATGTISIEDVMIQARLTAGALGTDLALLGFADQLAGGLGEGGFFRTSVQAAEKADIIRTALTECFNHVVDVHTLTKYGWCFDPGDRPYDFNFFGATSALDREQQETRERSTNAAAVEVQVMQQLRETGMPEAAVVAFMVRSMRLDEDYAKQLAKGLKDAKPPADAQGGGFGMPGYNDDNTDFSASSAEGDE